MQRRALHSAGTQSCRIPSTALKVKRLSVKQRRLQSFSCTIEKEKFSLTVDTNGGIIWMVPELRQRTSAGHQRCIY